MFAPKKILSVKKLRIFFIGGARDLNDKSIFHKISLVAFFAWIGLGSDGITSSCYGPEEAYRNLMTHTSLAIFVALATAFTIFIVSTSYTQIIKLFPFGGGGYIVASKLLSPTVGMISGCSLLIDYVLTITLSISSGADAIFSFFPAEWQIFKLITALLGVIILIILNMRGVRESVMTLTPIFVLFILLHVFVIIYVFISHAGNIGAVVSHTSTDINYTVSQIGIWGTIFLVLKAYSMGAGTFTGIEAVSNGIPVLREPRVKTARKTMVLMATSLSFIVVGLIVAYSLYDVKFQEGKTLNAVLFAQISQDWNKNLSYSFVLLILISEAALLFVAAQTGFLDGPRIMANMAYDSWFPKRFISISDRFVTQNGILLMGISSIVLLVVSGGSVRFLVILYSINVFITFSLSQLGMVRHWWTSRKQEKGWLHKIVINGIGLLLTLFILITVIVIKFTEGGWVTLLITGVLIIIAITIKRHYYSVTLKMQKLQTELMTNFNDRISKLTKNYKNVFTSIIKNPKAKTAVILVSDYNSTGITTLLNVIESFHGLYKNFIFLQIGVVNAHNFRSNDEVEKIKSQINDDLQKYVNIVNEFGYFGTSYWTVKADVVKAFDELLPEIQREFPDFTFFGSQLVFAQTNILSRLLHNHTINAVQKRLHKKNIKSVIFPINLEN
ncbi:MAG: amino acid permease [Bacteroidales bacterium]|nr:amino acid permease [Bacteroidales bacterium]